MTMKDQIFYIIGLATCIIVAIALILIAGYFLMKLWCKFIMESYQIKKNHRIIKDWFREKDSFNQWKEDPEGIKELKNFYIRGIDFDVESGEIKNVYCYAKNIGEAKKSIDNNEVFTIKSIPFIISYVDNNGFVEFTPVKYFRVEKS